MDLRRKEIIKNAVFSGTPEPLRKRADPLPVEEWKTKQFRNVREYIAPDCQAEDMVLLVDETPLNTGKEGVVFATNGIYTVFDNAPFYRPFTGLLQYEEIKAVKMPGEKPDRLQLYYYKDSFRVVCAPEKYLAFLFHALNAVLEAVRVDAAGQGNVRVQCSCASMFDEGTFGTTDREKALYWYEKAAEQGDKEAGFQCAQRYYQGVGTDVNLEKAWYWAEKAASKWHGGAELLCGRLYIRKGTVEDKREALYWLRRAGEHGQTQALTLAQDVEFELRQIKLKELEEMAASGDMDAQYDCAEMYRCGDGTEVNLQKAFHWYGKAAGKGHARAQYKYSEMYREGEGVEQNSEKAFYWCEKAARQNDVVSMLQCGIMCDEGDGTEINKEKALYWYEKVAELEGDPVVEAACGNRYDNGIGTKKDEEKALYWYEKAAQHGDVDSRFQCGRRYSKGIGVSVDKEKALYWYERAAEQGDSAAQFNTGLYYAKGTGTEVNEEKAFYWYEKAAQQGHVKAQYQCGERYRRGSGTEKDVGKAVDWLQKAAEQGHEKASGACEELRGEAYQAGSRIYLMKEEKEYETALSLLEAAARLGEAGAQYYLAAMYEEGLGTEKDLKKAIYWCEKAAGQGGLEAQIKAGDLRMREGIYYSSAAYWYEAAAEAGNEYAQFQCGVAYGWDENYKKAVKWFEPLAWAGNADAMYNCSISYGHLGNASEAVFWEERAIKNGCERAIAEKEWRDKYR